MTGPEPEQTWATEITPERTVRLEEELGWALQRQNVRFVQASVAVRARLALGCAAIVAVLAVICFILDPRLAHDQPQLFALLVLVFVLALATAKLIPRRRPAWSQRAAGRMLARTSSRTMAPLARAAPVTIDYRLTDSHVYARCAALRLERRLDLAKPGLIIHTDDALFVFRRRSSLNPMATLHASGAHREALLAALQRAGVTCEGVTGPSAGYGDVIPVARVR